MDVKFPTVQPQATISWFPLRCVLFALMRPVSIAITVVEAVQAVELFSGELCKIVLSKNSIANLMTEVLAFIAKLTLNRGKVANFAGSKNVWKVE